MDTIKIQLAQPQDEPFLWQMVYYASQMDKDGGKTVADAKASALLAKYVTHWGKPTDLGVIAWDGDQPVGAVWSRLDIGDIDLKTFVDQETPEIAAAVLPTYQGMGIGTRLLQAYLDLAKEKYTAVALNVRADNPAYRMYTRFGFQTINELTNRVGTKSYNMLLKW